MQAMGPLFRGSGIECQRPLTREVHCHSIQSLTSLAHYDMKPFLLGVRRQMVSAVRALRVIACLPEHVPSGLHVFQEQRCCDWYERTGSNAMRSVCRRDDGKNERRELSGSYAHQETVESICVQNGAGVDYRRDETGSAIRGKSTHSSNWRTSSGVGSWSTATSIVNSRAIVLWALLHRSNVA